MIRFCRFGEQDIYDGKVVGLYSPLQLAETPESVLVTGETFSYTFSRKTGQIVSAQALGTEYLAPGAQLPNPYIGLFPEDDPGASPLGKERTALYGWEKATRIKPPMYARELTNSPQRFDAENSVDVSLSIAEKGVGFVRINARGAYASLGQRCGVEWSIDYEIDVDGFMKIQVRAHPQKPVILQWHCYLRTRLSRDACQYLIPWSDLSLAAITDSGILPPTALDGRKPGLLYGANQCPYFHLGNVHTGIDFTKERFDGRLAGYRDAGIKLPDGFSNDFDSAQAPDGTWVVAADSRGKRDHMTQVFLHEDGVEVEEFDVRNTTFPFNPGEDRSQFFFLQLLPPKKPRQELNSVRMAWPGPHQVVMAGWADNREWHPPSSEEIMRWKETGVNLAIGGLHFFDGDAPSSTMNEEVRHYIKEAHAAGIKVIPYMTFNDFAFGSRDYRRDAPAWYYSACIEYRNETTLMCYNADGWRENFERQAEWILSNFEFDGLYVDHWATRKCDNARHGCGHAPFTWVTEAYHDIAKRARRVVARHTNGKGIMLLNSGGDPFAGCACMFDLRLQGENIDLKRVPEKDLALSMNPARQGGHAVVYPGHWRLSESFVCFVAASGHGYRVAEAFRKHNRAAEMLVNLSLLQEKFVLPDTKKISTFLRAGILECSGTGIAVNAFCRPGQALLVGARLPAASVGVVDKEACSASIRDAIIKAGIREHVAGRLASALEPFYLPLGAEATVDNLETAVRRAGRAESQSALVASQTETITAANPEALLLSESSGWEIKDLLGNAAPNLVGRAVSLTVHADQPFALLLTSKRSDS